MKKIELMDDRRAETAGYILIDFGLCAAYFVHIKKIWGGPDANKKVLWHVIIMNIILISIDITNVFTTYMPQVSDDLNLGVGVRHTKMHNKLLANLDRHSPFPSNSR